MKLAGVKVLVVGMGHSGRAAARLCLAKGAVVTALDQGNPAGLEELERAGARLVLGSQPSAEFAAAQLIVLSPGVDHRQPEIQAAQRVGIPVIGELELAWRFLTTPAVAVTGTNGKSTVTTLIARMLEAQGKKVFAGANLGAPLSEYVVGDQDADWAVLEVSSFQTDTMQTIHPKVSVVLNITDDHLDRYDSMKAYGDSKFRLLSNQGEGDLAVLNAADPEVWSRTQGLRVPVWPYGLTGPGRPGGWAMDDELFLALPDGRYIRLNAAQSKLHGGFNRQNMLAAGLTAAACGVAPEAMQKVIDEYEPLKHRMFLVGEWNGVAWYDDSKGTNVGAVLAAVAALDRPVVVLLGGRDKEGRFAQLKPVIQEKVRKVITFGEAGAKIARQLTGVGCLLAQDLVQAVELARLEAKAGDAVLLSPGCASFDAYTGYAQRGDHFQRLVREAHGAVGPRP